MAEWLRRGLQILMANRLNTTIFPQKSLLFLNLAFKCCRKSPVCHRYNPLSSRQSLSASGEFFGRTKFNLYPQSPTKTPGSFVGSFRSLFKVGPSSLSNFQSFPRGQSPPLEKNYYSFSLYCLIQTASLFKNILGSLSKGEKNIIADCVIKKI